jgi:hypothetical protein
MSAKEIVVEKTMEPQETSMVRSGNERSQSQSFTKSMDLAKSPPQVTIVAPTEKVVKNTPMKKRIVAPTSVEGVDWVVLKPKTLPTKKLFKIKSLPN